MQHTEQPTGDHAGLLPGTAATGSSSAARVRAGLVALLVLALLALCVTGYSHLRYRSAISAAAQQNIETRTQRAVAEIDGIARKAMDEVDTITRGLSAGTIAPHDAVRHFERALAANRDISGLVVAYRPLVKRSRKLASQARRPLSADFSPFAFAKYAPERICSQTWRY